MQRTPHGRAACLSIALLCAAGACRAADGASPADAVRKALPLLVKGAKGHAERRTCFACHNQGIPLLALTAARDRGLAVDGKHVKEQLEHVAAFLAGNRARYIKGQGQGGQADMAGYALLALEWGGWAPDETTYAVVEYLLLWKKDLDHYPASGRRPPSEGSPFTATYVALRGLRHWGTAGQRERIAGRVAQVKPWLLRTPARDTEDRVFRLWGLREAGVKGKELAAAAGALLRTQRGDGAWAQLDGKDGDAYATGSALVALHQAGGLPVDSKAYQRGVAYLLKTQRPDGSWRVRSRSRPFQKYFESGFPHGKDQFVSMAATGWAAAALALACPDATKEKPFGLRRPAR
jgi:hypothetical protein